jgi:hypothetical protein
LNPGDSANPDTTNSLCFFCKDIICNRITLSLSAILFTLSFSAFDRVQAISLFIVDFAIARAYIYNKLTTRPEIVIHRAGLVSRIAQD